MMDVDGVLADFVLGFTQLLRERIGESIRVRSHRDQETWDFDDIPPAHVEAGWREVKHSITFWESLGSLIAYREWIQLQDLLDRADVYFVTNRVGPDCRAETRGWLESHLSTRNFEVIISPHKAEVARALRARYTLEDNVENAVGMAYSPGVESYLLDRRYNQLPADGPPGCRVGRVRSVGEFVNRVLWEAGK